MESTAETVILIPRKKPRRHKGKHRWVPMPRKGYDLRLAALVVLIGALPIVAIPIDFLGILPIQKTALFIMLPLFLVAVPVLWGKKEGRVLVLGLAAGLVATFAYDIFRWGFISIGVLQDFFPLLGGEIRGDHENNLLLGYAWRYFGDGGGLAIVYFMGAAVFWKWAVLRRFPVLAGIAFGVTVWSGLVLTTILTDKGKEILFVPSFAPMFATWLGHVVYGTMLGFAYMFFRGRRGLHFRKIENMRMKNLDIKIAVTVIVLSLVALLGVSFVTDDNAGAGEAQPPAAPSEVLPQQEVPPIAGEGVLQSCEDSVLEPHDGSQTGSRCSSNFFGEVPSEEETAQLLITAAPETVAADEDFTLSISTRNLIRDTFLPAGDDLYYAAPGELNDDGITQGHVHMACRFLESAEEAPPSEPEPAYFVVNDDGGGGEGVDTFDVEVPALGQAGTLQCTAWAGDASHRVPLQVRANQTPAIDSVRIEVQ